MRLSTTGQLLLLSLVNSKFLETRESMTKHEYSRGLTTVNAARVATVTFNTYGLLFGYISAYVKELHHRCLTGKDDGVWAGGVSRKMKQRPSLFSSLALRLPHLSNIGEYFFLVVTSHNIGVRYCDPNAPYNEQRLKTVIDE